MTVAAVAYLMHVLYNYQRQKCIKNKTDHGWYLKNRYKQQNILISALSMRMNTLKRINFQVFALWQGLTFSEAVYSSIQIYYMWNRKREEAKTSSCWYHHAASSSSSSISSSCYGLFWHAMPWSLSFMKHIYLPTFKACMHACMLACLHACMHACMQFNPIFKLPPGRQTVPDVYSEYLLQ